MELNVCSSNYLSLMTAVGVHPGLELLPSKLIIIMNNELQLRI